MKKQNNKKYTKSRHKFYFALVRPVGWLIARKYHFKTKPVKFKKGEQYLILSNHQGVMDPIFLSMSIKGPVYFMANDGIFDSSLSSRLLSHCFAPIKKRKAIADMSCIRTVCRVAQEGGTVAVFPEGNRSWCDRPFYIDRAIVKLIRLLKLPVILYNFRGGFGVNPRWSDVVREGEYTGGISRTLSREEIAAMGDDELYDLVLNELNVTDEGGVFRSPRRAENLERMLFVCPSCGGLCTLTSKGARVTCKNCGAAAEYCEDLTLSSADGRIPFKNLAEWYAYQQRIVQGFRAIESGETLFSDEVVAYDKTSRKKIKLGKRTLALEGGGVRLGDIFLPADGIINSTVQGGRKLILNTIDKSYFIVGGQTFNPIKYLLFFNVLCERIKQTGGDRYYGLGVNAGSR